MGPVSEGPLSDLLGIAEHTGTQGGAASATFPQVGARMRRATQDRFSNAPEQGVADSNPVSPTEKLALTS
jgi:hypothetical protein